MPRAVAAATSPSPSPSPCGGVNGAPIPQATIPPGLHLPKVTDADIQAAMQAGSDAARDILKHPPTPPPNTGAKPVPGGLAPCAASGNLQDLIYHAALAFVGTNTCGLHGASGSEACMASVNQILMNAGIAPIGPGPNGANFIPTAVLGYPNRMVEIPQSATVPGDLMVRHSPGDTYFSSAGDEHITVCITYGCTEVVSNASSTCTFGWYSGFDLCYLGSPYCSGYSQFYRVTQ